MELGGLGEGEAPLYPFVVDTRLDLDLGVRTSCGMRQAGALPRAPVEPMKLTTAESAGKVATASSSNPLCCAEVWQPWQKADGAHIGSSGEHEEEDSTGAILPQRLSLSNALEALQEV